MSKFQNTPFLPEPMDREINEMEAGLFASTLKALVIPAAICVGGIALFASLPAKAQSFSCAKAEQSSEFAICNDENLLLLDERLGRIYASNYVNASTTPQRQAVTRAQSKWLKKRNSCKTDFTCLTLRYEERLRILQNRVAMLNSSLDQTK